MNGAEIAFSNTRWCFHTLPVKFISGGRGQTSVFSPVSWLSVSFQSSMGHSTNTAWGDAFELPCVSHTEVHAF